MKFEDKGDQIEVYDHSFIKAADVLLGVIKRFWENGNFFHFLPARECILSGGQIISIYRKISDLNVSEEH